MGSISDWQIIIQNLASEYHCIAPDLPGHGQSINNISQNSLNIANTAKFIVNILQQNNLINCNLLGYSMGGRIAIYLAIHYPDLFNKIIIESAQPGIKDKKERNQRKNQDLALSKKIKSEELSEFLNYWYNQPLFSTLKNHKNFANLLQSRLKNNPELLSQSLIEMGTGTQPSLWNKLNKIKNSCLMITGEHDLKYQKIFSKMHKEILLSKFVIIKNCGHNVHFENPQEFSKVVLTFLSK